jgi:cytochrome c oxidase subunit 3
MIMEKTASISHRPRQGTAKIALYVVLASETIFFGTLLSAYFFLRASLPIWPLGPITVTRLIGPAANTLLLLISALTMYLGLRAIRQNRPESLKAWLSLTLSIGLIFVAGQVLEFTRSGMKITDQAFGGVFFTLMGFHAVHVIAGVVMLVLLLWRTFQGDFTARRYIAIQVGAWFWYFIVAVWVVLFSALYLA